MFVSGFSFIRNAIKFDYPIIEAITSVLDICDEFIVAIGNSDDETISLIESIPSDKIKIIHTVWDDSLREGGRVLADETNKAKEAISNKADWCLYIQGDECIHEKYLPTIKKTMEENLNNLDIDGLLLKYEHFYGSYQWVGDSRRWYRREIRIIKNDKQIKSWGDAQGFRKNGKKLRVKLIDAYVYHYGWVKNPLHQKQKESYFHRFWHGDDWIKNHVQATNEFDYSQIDSLAPFKGTHPDVMKKRVENQDWQFNYDIKAKKLSLKNKVLKTVEAITGIRLFEYRNYILVK